MTATSLSRSMGKLISNTSTLFICDVQERYSSIIHCFPAALDISKRMARVAGILGVPVVCTVQSLGPACDELVEAIPTGTLIVQKATFSMMTPEVEEHLEMHPNIRQVMLLGTEAHICVLQTTLDLLEKGYEVHLLVDGISSQRPHDRAVALQRLSDSGAILSTSETATFQMMRDAKHKDYTALSALVKEERGDPIPGILL